MRPPYYWETQALEQCGPLPTRLYRNGLLKLLDASDGHVRGPRRLVLTMLVSEVGPVARRGHLQRPLQHGELVRLLDQLALAGLLESHGDEEELDLLLVHRAPLVAA
ncbi:hypothetical protein JCM19000A_32660 [Silvimonas sp. JCM 19000]